MNKFDEKKFKEYLKNRKAPKLTPKDIIVQGVKIKNVPVIIHEEGSFEFTIPFGSASKIYKLLAINKITKKLKEIDYQQEDIDIEAANRIKTDTKLYSDEEVRGKAATNPVSIDPDDGWE